MIKSYLKIAIRNAARDWQYTAINIFGLAFGIAAFLFIFSFVQKESDIDTFHADGDRIFKYYSDLKWNSMEARFPQSPPALGTATTVNFPEVEYVTRIRTYYHTPVKIDDRTFLETNSLGVDSNFLKVFTYQVIEGNPDELFKDPTEVVLSQSYALKYFGEESAIGKFVEILGTPRKVTGVIRDYRDDSHIRYGILLPLSADRGVERMEWSWLWSNLNTYIKLREGADVQSVEEKLPKLVQDNAGLAIQRITGSSLEDFFNNGNRLSYYTVPLADLYYDDMNGLGPSGNKMYLRIFMIIAFIILLLACINYINLSTARSMKRAKEVGIRKVVGGQRKELIFQFFIEAILFSLVAAVIAIGIGIILNGQLKTGFDIRWDLSPISAPQSILVIVLTTLGVSALCGLYPSLYLSSFQPAKTLKGKETGSGGVGLFRRFLVVIQFITSFGIITMAFTANSQLSYLKKQDLGFKTDRLLVIENADFLENQMAFKQKVLERADIQRGSFSNFVPGIGGNFEVFKKIGAWDEDYMAFLVDTDEDFFETYEIEILEGVPFDESDVNKDEKRVVINELAVKDFGLEEPLGSKIQALDRGGELTVSGVMEEINFFMAQQEPTETVIRPYNDSTAIFPMGYFSVRLNTDDYNSTIEGLNDMWVAENTGVGFDYTFYDQIFDDTFQRENRLSGLMNVFSILAIIIAMLGLVGLISYSAEQAKKMIGIRKVFGASVTTILVLLTWDFLKLLLIAFVISIPVVNYFMKDWLAGFTYQIDISVWLFLIPGILVLALALITSWVQTYKAAVANPIDSIGKE